MLQRQLGAIVQFNKKYVQDQISLSCNIYDSINYIKCKPRLTWELTDNVFRCSSTAQVWTRVFLVLTQAPSYLFERVKLLVAWASRRVGQAKRLFFFELRCTLFSTALAVAVSIQEASMDSCNLRIVLNFCESSQSTSNLNLMTLLWAYV